MQRLTIGILAVLALAAAPAAERIEIGAFSDNGLAGWKEREFKGNTRHDLVQSQGAQVVRARTSNAASGLYREQAVDLKAHPWLNWRWKVTGTYSGVDERSRSGDDYPARVYVVFSGGIALWKTRAINYVWSNNQPVGTQWPNAFTDNARMIAVESGGDKTGEWIMEKRNVRDDYRRLFGEPVDSVDAVAIMSDSDNAGGRTTAYYGDIYFTRD